MNSIYNFASILTLTTASKKIQTNYRKYKCKQITNEVVQLNLAQYDEKKNNINDFKKMVFCKKINNTFDRFCNYYNNYKQFSNKSNNMNRMIISMYFINNFPKHFFVDTTNPLINGLQLSTNTLHNLIHHNNRYNVDKLWDAINYFIRDFSRWSIADKNKLIEDCIMVYCNKCLHIDKIKSGELVRKENFQSEEQTNNMLEELTRQQREILSSIKSLDQTFDIQYLENNYNIIYNSIMSNKEKIQDAISINMAKAYLDMISDDLKNGSLLSVSNIIKNIGYNLSNIVPNINKNKFSEKFTDSNITNLLFDNAFTPELIKFIYFMFDFLIMIDAPVNDVDNLKYKEEIAVMVTKEFSLYFP